MTPISRLQVADAATYIGISISTLNKLRVFGGGPVYLKLGRRVAYDVADLNEWLASKRRTSTSDDGSRVDPVKRRARLDPRRAKVHWNYSIADVAKLYGVHRNTVRAWIDAGLETVRPGKEVLILGDTLRSFLEKKRQAGRCTTPPGWLFCFRCKTPRPPGLGMMELVQVRSGTANVRAVCGVCAALMHRRVSLARLEKAGFAELGPNGDGGT